MPTQWELERWENIAKNKAVLAGLGINDIVSKKQMKKAIRKARPDPSKKRGAPREGEVDGRDYHFVDLEEFRRMVAEDAFLEWAHVFDNRYGTPRAQVEALLAAGKDVLFDIDWQGAQQLFQIAGGDVVRVFILPPSMQELERRLRARGTDSDDVVAFRMARAASEISHWAEYDYVLVNRDMGACLEQVRSIVAAERLKRQRQIGLVPFVRDLVAGR